MNFMKTLLILLLLAGITKLFFTRTTLGKMLLLVLKDIYFIIKLSVKIIKSTVGILYKISKQIYLYLEKHYGDKDDKKNKNTQNKKKVVNGNNIIDINKYTKQRNSSKKL